VSDSPISPQHAIARLRQWLWLLILLNMGLTGCWRPPAPDPNELKAEESRLALQDVTLEENDLNGKPIWKIKAKKANYSPDRKVATLQRPTGEFFEAGKPTYHFTAQTAQVRQDQPYVKLLGQVVMTELKHKVVLKTATAEWQPQQHLIVIPTPLTIAHEKLQASATQGRVFSRQQRAELIGNIVAVTRDPQLRLTTERLEWLMNAQQLTTDRLVHVEHFTQGKPSDRGQGNYMLADQRQKTVLLQKQAQLVLQDPPLDIASESLLWDLQNRRVNSNVPVEIEHRQENMVIKAQEGWVDLPAKIYYLSRQVQGKGKRQQATFTSDKFTWFMATNQFSAEGNFIYEQQQPKFQSRSPVAQGEFKEQFVVLHGGQTRVESQITPSP
jgi:LPS export ABC transporter protein LptC